MTIVGLILLVAGIAIGGLVFTGAAPEAILNLNAPFWVWIVMAVVGLALVVFNRRTAD